MAAVPDTPNRLHRFLPTVLFSVTSSAEWLSHGARPRVADKDSSSIDWGHELAKVRADQLERCARRAADQLLETGTCARAGAVRAPGAGWDRVAPVGRLCPLVRGCSDWGRHWDLGCMFGRPECVAERSEERAVSGHLVDEQVDVLRGARL